jgi:hypothetical protein
MAKEKGGTVTVIANKQGYDNVVVREPGDVFEVPADWMDKSHTWFDKAVARKVAQEVMVADTGASGASDLM